MVPGRAYWMFARLAPSLVRRIRVPGEGGSAGLKGDKDAADSPLEIPEGVHAYATIGSGQLLTIQDAALEDGRYVNKVADEVMKRIDLRPGHRGEAHGGLTRVAVSLGQPMGDVQGWPEEGVVLLAAPGLTVAGAAPPARDAAAMFESLVRGRGQDLPTPLSVWSLDGHYSSAALYRWEAARLGPLAMLLRKAGWDTYCVPVLRLADVLGTHYRETQPADLRAIVSAQPGWSARVRKAFDRMQDDIKRTQGEKPKVKILLGPKDLALSVEKFPLLTFARSAWKMAGTDARAPSPVPIHWENTSR